MTLGFKDKNKKFHPINQKIGVRKSRDQHTKTQGVLIRKKLAVIPSRVEKGNAFNDTNVIRPRVQTVVKNPYEFGDNEGITLRTDPNNPLKIGDTEYWLDLVVHWGKKRFGLEVQTCRPHKKESERDKFTGKDCFGGFIAFSKEPEDLLEIMDKTFNVKFDNDPQQFDLWKRKILTEFEEPEPQASAMQKLIERLSDELEEKTKIAVMDLLAGTKLRESSMKRVKETLEEASENVDLEINNFDFDSSNREEVLKELQQIEKRTREHVEFRIEQDFAQNRPVVLKKDPKLNTEFPIGSRIGNQFVTGIMQFTKKRLLSEF